MLYAPALGSVAAQSREVTCQRSHSRKTGWGGSGRRAPSQDFSAAPPPILSQSQLTAHSIRSLQQPYRNAGPGNTRP